MEKYNVNFFMNEILKEESVNYNNNVSETVRQLLNKWYENNKDRLVDVKSEKVKNAIVVIDENTMKMYELFITDMIKQLIENSK